MLVIFWILFFFLDFTGPDTIFSTFFSGGRAFAVL